MTFSYLSSSGWLGAVLLVVGGCVAEEVADEAGQSALPVCQAPNAERITDDVDTVCSCVVEDITDVLRHSCIKKTTPQVLDRLAEVLFDSCASELGSCRATLEDFEACSAAANVEFAETCNVDFPEECLPFALASGCAFYVGCPEGFESRIEDGVASCEPSRVRAERETKLEAPTYLERPAELAPPSALFHEAAVLTDALENTEPSEE